MKIDPGSLLLISVGIIIFVTNLVRHVLKKRREQEEFNRERERERYLARRNRRNRLMSLPGLNRFRKPWEDVNLLEKVLRHDMVTAVEVDRYNRIIITTKPLYVKIAKKDKILGKYQIRIDFLQSFHMIQILNISQRYQTHDGIHLNNTLPCLGNIENEITSMWLKRDLEGLVDLLLYFIVSPNKGEHAYVDSWDIWFQHATPCPRGFNFEEYDNGQRQITPSQLAQLDLTPAQRQSLAHQQATRDNNGGDPM